MTFNSKLYASHDSLRRELTDSRIVYIDIYRPLLDLIQNPEKYGKSHFLYSKLIIYTLLKKFLVLLEFIYFILMVLF